MQSVLPILVGHPASPRGQPRAEAHVGQVHRPGHAAQRDGLQVRRRQAEQEQRGGHRGSSSASPVDVSALRGFQSCLDHTDIKIVAIAGILRLLSSAEDICFQKLEMLKDF